MNERLEMQASGSIFASLVGAKEAGEVGDRRHEGYDLRRLTADKSPSWRAGDLRNCFEAGMKESPYRTVHYRDLCDGRLQDKDFVVWNKLDQHGQDGTRKQTCTAISSSIPERDLSSCSLVSRYERARFGTEQDKDENSKPDNLWKCHIDLSKRERKRAKNVTTKWDLILPVPSKYNVNGGALLNQLNLDAGSRL